MKKVLQWMFLLMLMGSVGTIQAQSFNYNCDFEDAADTLEWLFLNGTVNKWHIDTALNNTPNGTKCMYVSDNGGVTHSYSNISRTFGYAYHDVTLEVGTYDLSYDWMANGEGSGSYKYDYLRVVLIPESAVLPTTDPYRFSNTLPTGWIALDGGSSLNQNSTWQNYYAEVDITVAGNYRLAFIWRNDSGGGSNPPAAVDNISFKVQTCPKPTDAIASNVLVDGATISWTETGTASSWVMEYGVSGFSRGSGTVVSDIYDNPYSITGLEANTPYDVYVASLCDAEDTSKYVKTSFRTACSDIELPYYESFDSYNDGDVPFCWFIKQGGVNGNTHNAITGTSMQLKGSAIFVSPKITTPMNEVGFYFAAKAENPNSSGYLEIGVVTDTIAWNYTAVKTIIPTDKNFHYYEVDFDNIDVSEGGYIVINQKDPSSNIWYWWIDEINIFQLGDCRAPYNYMFTGITDNSATLSWECASDGANFQIRYGNETIDVEGETTVTLTDLDANARYNPMIRTKCPNDSSYWQEMGTFVTEPTCAQLVEAKAENIATDAASISWRYSETGNAHTGVIVKYKMTTADDWTEVSVDGNSYIMTDLTPDEEYTVEVMTVCSQDTSEVKTFKFKTRSGVCGEAVGEGDNQTDYIPLNGYYRYSYSQSIYPNDVVAGMDSIKGIVYNTTSYAQTRNNVTVYIGNTDQSVFASAADYVPLSSMTMVYNSSFDFSGQGWDTIMFTTPYVTNGHNVVICVIDGSGTSLYARVKFRFHEGSSLYKYADTEPVSPTSYGVNTYEYVPDIRFIGECSPVTCKAPVVACASSDASSVTFAWRPGLDETEWTVDYRAMGESNWIELNANTTDTFAVISGLLPGQGYEARVGSICNEDTLYSMAHGFTTCDIFNIPYFDDYESDNLNSCWRYGSVLASNGVNPSNSQKALKMPANSYVVMSTFSDPVNTLQLRFDLDDEGKSAPLYVGVCTEQNSISTFTVVDTAYIDPLDPTAEILVHLNTYEGDGQYIALMTGSKDVKIDNLYVETIPSCPKPLHVHITDLGSSFMTVAWDNDEFATSWNATIVASGEAIENGTTISCDNAVAEFTDLNAHTTYDIYINAVCNSENSSSVMITMTTLGADPVALPYNTDFSNEDENAQWSFTSCIGSNNWTIGNAISYGNANSLYVSDDNGITNHYANNVLSVSFAYIPVHLNEDGLYAASYDWIGKGENNWDFARIALVPIAYNFAAAPKSRDGYNGTLPLDWIALDNGNLQAGDSWQSTIKKATIAAGSYLLTVVWTNDRSGGSSIPVAIDNLSLMQVTCPEPVGVQVSEISAHSATLSWIDDGMASNGWEVTIDGTDPVVVMDTFYTFDNLTAGQAHTASVRSICGEDSYSIAISKSFYTLCSDLDVLPYRNNFDSEELGNAPYCWTTSTNSEYPKVDNDYLKFYCTSYDNILQNVISLPRLSDEINLNELEMTFNAKNGVAYGEHKFYIGVSNVAGDLTSFVAVDTIITTSSWEKQLVFFNNYTGTGRYITFMTNLGSNNVDNTYIDDVVLQQSSPCGRPTNASIQSYTHKSAVVSWSDTNADATFKVALSTTNNVLGADTIITNIATTSYLFNDLEGSTTYYVWVASDCTDTISDWVSAGHFTTYPTCGAVIDINVYDIDESHATISWNNPIHGEPVTDYIVSCKKNYNAPTIDTIQVPYIFLSNLEQDSTYTVAVTTLCDSVVSSANSCTFVPTPLPSCNTVGVSGQFNTSYAPSSTNYRYSISQIIYKADEMIGMGDTIHGISFERNAAGSNISDVRNIVVYMGLTNKTNCLDGWMDTNDMTVVYRGPWVVNNGICDIDFPTPYIYNDHTKNIVLMFDDNTGSYKFSTFKSNNTNEKMVIYARQDNENVGVHSSFNSTFERPNIIFDATCAPITCYPPSIVISNVCDTAVSLVWRAGNDETAWTVEYKTVDEDTWTVAYPSTTNLTETINNLYPGTDYMIRVGSLCSDQTLYRTLNFSTECGPMPLPFKEDFNATSTGKFEKVCWYANGNTYNSSSDQSPIVSNLINNGHMVRLYDNAWIALPEMRGELNNLQMRLRYRASGDNVYTIVGYMDDPNAINTFHAVDTIYDNSDIYGSYHTILFNNVPADAEGNIAIYTPHTLNYTFVDDIIVEPIRSCVEPTNVTIDNITATSANVSWNGNANNYIVEYGETGFAVRNEHGTTTTATSNNVTLSGLTMGTTYDVFVRAICGAGDTSYTSNANTFTTDCAPITTFPYVMNFELNNLPSILETGVVPNCWTAFTDSANVSNGDRPQIIYDGRNNYTINGNYTLRLSKNGFVVLPEMAADIDTLSLHFYNKTLNAGGRIVVGVLDHIGDGFESTFQAVDTIVPINTNEMNSYVVYFRNYTGNGKYIAIRNTNIDANTTINTQYFDSIVVDYLPTCPEVVNLEAVAITSTTVTVDWDDLVAPAESYQIVYGTPGFNFDETGTSVIATTHPFVISGLEMLHNYEIWVRPICSDGDTGFFGYRPLTIQTALCDNPTVYTTAPNGTNDVSDMIPMAGFYRHSYSQTIIDATYLNGLTDISGIKLKESLSSNNNMNNIQIWMSNTNITQYNAITDAISTNNMTLVYTGNLEYEDGFITIPLDETFTYDGTSNLAIAILRDADSYERDHDFDIVNDTVNKTIYSQADWGTWDHLNLNPSKSGLVMGHAAFEFVECGEGCAQPILQTVTDITYESATIHWTANSTDCEVAIRAQEDIDMSTPIAVTGNSYTFTNLTPNQTYTYYVRQICDATTGIYSDWAESTFTTSDLPCFTPTDVVEVSHTAESITIDWNAAEGQNKWVIHTYNTLEDHIDTTTAHPATINGLIGGQTYQVAVQAICATNYTSEWSDTIEVVTSDCLPVNNVIVSNITVNSAKITWTAGGNEASWEVNYGDEGFGQGEGEIATTNTNSYIITGLESETSYDVYVRALCSTDFYSVWSEVVTFETLAEDNPPESIDGVEGNYQFTIYPNPTNGATTIKLNGVEGEVEINIVDMNGRTITTETISCGSDCEKRLDVTNLSQGTYFVRVLGNNINSVRKLIVR